MSDLGLITVDTLLQYLISFKINSNLFSISSRVFAILSFFSYRILVQTCISLLTKLGSFNCDSELHPLIFPWFSETTLIKVRLPVARVSAWVLSTSLSGGVSSLLDLLFLLFPFCATAKGCFADQEVEFMLKFFF